jgi:hypothetical protein
LLHAAVGAGVEFGWLLPPGPSSNFGRWTGTRRGFGRRLGRRGRADGS